MTALSALDRIIATLDADSSAESLREALTGLRERVEELDRLRADKARSDAAYAGVCVALMNAGCPSFAKATDAVRDLAAERDRLRADNEWRAIDSAPRGEVIRLRMDTGAVVAGYYCGGAIEVGIEPAWVALVPAATGRTCMPVVTPIAWLPLPPNAELSGGRSPSA